MRIYVTLLFLIGIAIGCSSPQDGQLLTGVQERNNESVSVDDRAITLDQCKLYEETQAGPLLLYDFEGYESCYFMEYEGQVKVFQSASGTVIPLGIPLETGENCKTSAYAIVYRDNNFYLSSKFYSRFQCETFNWPEKPFHVLASDAVQLPTADIAFEESH